MREDTLEPLILLEDEPVPDFLIDELKLLPFSKVVAGAALGTRGPFTIGVFADWGLGKTSVLRQARSLIDKKIRDDARYDEFITVWFNAWQYEKEEHPIIPLIASIVTAIEEKNAGHFDEEGKAINQGLAKISRALRAIAYGFSTKAKVKIPGFAEIETQFIAKEMIQQSERLKSVSDPLLDRSLYFNAFRALEDVVSESGDGKLGGGDSRPKIVVFIDDLDRCLPAQGLKLLESMKLILCQPGFIFVLAVAHSILEGYITKRYVEEFGIEEYASGNSYLDKLVQLPLTLPPHKSRFENYIDGLLNRSTFSGDNEPVKKALKHLVKYLAIGCEYNPRTLVRNINNLIVDRSIWVSIYDKMEEETLAICVVSRILEQRLSPQNFNLLVNDQELCKRIINKDEYAGWQHIEKENLKSSQTSHAARLEKQQKVIEQLNSMEFLFELLDTEIGKSWLNDQKRRSEVRDFFVEQRAESITITTSQLELIENEIRKTLGKTETNKISKAERASVSKLELSYSGTTDDGLKHLAGLAGLSELSLAGNQITGDGLKYLASLTGLSMLSLDENQITGDGLQYLASLTGLSRLWLDDNQITGDGLQYLASLTGLIELTLNDNQITGDGLQYLASLTGLIELTLNDNQITDDGLKYLAGLNGLSELALNENQITGDGLKYLTGLTGLSKLTLNDNQMTGDGLKYLTGLTGLSNLCLDGNHLTIDGLQYLASLNGLSMLWLDGNQITDDGLMHLAGLTGLRELTLNDNQITDDGLMHLAGLTGLRELYLDANQITDDGLMHLAGLTELSELSLDSNQITGDGLKNLAGLTGLRELHLKGNHVTDDGIKHLASLTWLSALHLDANQITEAGKKLLTASLVKTRINIS